MEPPAGTPDEELLGRFVSAGDPGAFAELVRRHGPMVLGVGRRMLRDSHAAEDVFQAAFLILCRKAGTVPPSKPLGQWLHSVAVRTALNVRAGARRRAERERRAAAMPPLKETAREEIRPALDEEVDRLPEKYRSPLVLCYLEGRTNESAARRLGWPTGTVKTRLGRACELLRERLARRGIGVTGAVLAGLLAEKTAAAVPAALVAQTAAAASGAGAVSGAVGALVEGGLKAMMWAQMKLAAAVMAAVTVAGAGGAAAVRALAGEPQASTPAAAAGDIPEIPAADFDRLHARIRPQPGESPWREIPWLTSIRQARERAAAEDKPILILTAADGSPISRT
jgi:RNA polymerase sigma factor (sigma-70 family)